MKKSTSNFKTFIDTNTIINIPLDAWAVHVRKRYVNTHIFDYYVKITTETIVRDIYISKKMFEEIDEYIKELNEEIK